MRFSWRVLYKCTYEHSGFNAAKTIFAGESLDLFLDFLIVFYNLHSFLGGGGGGGGG
jgi:hypothetical protein